MGEALRDLSFALIKGVKKVRSAVHHIISKLFKKETMLKNCVFHEPVIPCNTL